MNGTSVTRQVEGKPCGPDEPGRRGLLFSALVLIALLEGMAVMVIEITAARIMTPYFGQTVFVWTNLIGIILAAIAVGNYFGGRLADRSRSWTPLFFLLLLSGLFCLVVPFLTDLVARFFLGEGLRLEEAFPVLIRGSFATGFLVFAPPVFLQGACLPFLVKAASDLSGKVGRASGAIYGCSTFGSIVGTFLSTYLLIDLLGSRRTFFATGLALIAAASIGLIAARSRKMQWGGGIMIVFCALLLLGGANPSRGFPHGDQALFEAESRYQYIRAERKEAEPETIHLVLNEGLDSFHSVYVKGQVLTNGQYYDYYGLLPALAGFDQPRRVCIVGLAGGTSARQYSYFFSDPPGMSIDGVEIDGMTVEVGRNFMDLGSAQSVLNIYEDMDGRSYLSATRESYDVVIVDAYAKQVYIPFHLATKEFFELVRDKLIDGGIVGLNVNGYSFSDNLLVAIARTAASVFDSVAVARLPGQRNFMIYAVKGKGYIDPRTASLAGRSTELQPLLDELARFGVTRKFVAEPGDAVLTDDHAPVEFLCDQDLITRSKVLMDQLETTKP